MESSVYQMSVIIIIFPQTAPVCKIISYIEMLTALASVINLSAVSMERWELNSLT